MTIEQLEEMRKTKAEEKSWKENLPNETYKSLVDKETEKPYSGKYYDHMEEGEYLCRGCGNEIFSSHHKYISGSGWPCFWAPINEDAIVTKMDHSLGIERTEILCSSCGGHHGHMFEDGPEPTGLRYCVNSAGLEFRPASEEN